MAPRPGGWVLWVWVLGAVAHGVSSQSCAPDASLVGLTVSAGGGAGVACTFDTAFDPTHDYYECQLPHVEHDVVVTPLPADFTAEMEVRCAYIHIWKALCHAMLHPQRIQPGLCALGWTLVVDA